MRFRGVAPVVLVACLAAGCTSDGPAAPSDTPTTAVTSSVPSTTAPVSTPASSSPTPSVATTGPNVRPGETPPVLARIAHTDSPEGAAAFAKSWFLAWDWAYATGDAALLRRYSASSCSDCDQVISIFTEARKKSQHFVGGRLRVGRAAIANGRGQYGSSSAVDVTLGQDSFKIIASNGAIASRAAATPSITFRLWLKRAGDGWTVVQKGHVER